MSNLFQTTPCLHVPDFERALAFFTDLLGFTCPARHGAPGYAYVEREGAAFRPYGMRRGRPLAPRRCGDLIVFGQNIPAPGAAA